MIRRLMGLFLVLLAPAAPAEPELLRAEQAFRYEARAEGAQLAIRWQVADGYYLLDLQIPPFLSDAAPSRPLLYPVRPA